MRIGLIGIGKLGMPVAVCMALKGHDVMANDLNPDLMTKDNYPHQETGPGGVGAFKAWLRQSTVRFGEFADVVAHSDILFVCVQTPHDPMYEGVTPLTESRVDFDYKHLVNAVNAIAMLVTKPTIVAVVSTVLPGTTERELLPITKENPHISLCYNPSFIAMGTVMKDFLDPEFVLIGTDNVYTAATMGAFYGSICIAPIRCMSIASAETTKVCYNTFISLKIAFANTVMEVCEHVGADCEDVMGALKGANRRLISPAYLTPGMGDGGGCHPRDNIAMSWFARQRGLSFDFFEAGMKCREEQTRWLCEIVAGAHRYYQGLPVVILGQAFKPETNIVTGSPAMLAGNILQGMGIDVTYADDSVGTEVTEGEALSTPAVFLIGCRHERYRSIEIPPGSVVIDPHRIVRASESGAFKLHSLGGRCKAR